MLYITSLVLIITGNLYLLTVFIQFPSPPTPASGNHKPDLFFYGFVCFWSRIDLKDHVSSWSTNSDWIFLDVTQWSPWQVQLPSITIQRYYTSIHSIPHMTWVVSMTHLFRNWKFIPLNLPHLVLWFPTAHPSPIRISSGSVHRWISFSLSVLLEKGVLQNAVLMKHCISNDLTH